MMNEQPTQAKSQLAKLLATENITVRHDGAARTASFDVKGRVLTLPVWQNISPDLYDMLVIHEVGHALDTPYEAWMNAINALTVKHHGSEKHRAARAIKSFLNIAEDARIDKRQKRRYPGCRKNYILGYKELIERDFFGTKKRDVNSMSFIDRMNMYFKGGAMMGIQFSAEERKFVRRAETIETFEEMVQLADDLYTYAKARGEEEKQNQPEPEESDEDDFEEGFGGEGEGEGDFEESDETDDSDETETGSNDQSDEDGDDADDTDEGFGGDDTDDEDESPEAGNSSRDDGDDDDDDGADADSAEDENDFVPEASTDEAAERNAGSIVNDGSTRYNYMKLPSFNLENIVDDYKVVMTEIERSVSYLSAEAIATYAKQLADFKTDENAVISFMVKEFEMRKAADVYARIGIAKTGVIDTNKLHSYKYNEDVFRKLAVTPSGKNHGFVMFIDWSGSMNENIRKTVKQLLSMVLFCKRVQVPFEVYSFRDVNSDDTQKNGRVHEIAKDKISVGRFRLRNLLSSRMNTIDLNRAMRNLWIISSHIRTSECMNGTPLNQTIMVADKIVNQFKARNKLQVVNTIFLTDGESNGLESLGVQDTYGYSSGHQVIKRQVYILHDEVTKKDYYLPSGDRWGYPDGRGVTATLLKMLKDRTGCNLIGFYLTEYNFKTFYPLFFGNDTAAMERNQKFWKENNFLPVKSAGYDDYFILNPKTMGVLKTTLEVNPSMSRAKIAKAFTSFSEKKSVNRVLLRQFIDLVTNNTKKIA